MAWVHSQNGNLVWTESATCALETTYNALEKTALINIIWIYHNNIIVNFINCVFLIHCWIYMILQEFFKNIGSKNWLHASFVTVSVKISRCMYYVMCRRFVICKIRLALGGINQQLFENIHNDSSSSEYMEIQHLYKLFYNQIQHLHQKLLLSTMDEEKSHFICS